MKNGNYIDLFRSCGIELPDRETDVSCLTAQQVIEKQREFWARYEHAGKGYEDTPIDFMEVFAEYPVSMCKREMTPTLKLLMALFYVFKPIGISNRINDPHEREIMRFLEQNWPPISYEQLALVFCRSKATVFQAIHEKEAEARKLVEEGQLRREARAIATQQLIEEEKEKLRLEQNIRKEQANKRTNALLPSVEDICSEKK